MSAPSCSCHRLLFQCLSIYWKTNIECTIIFSRNTRLISIGLHCIIFLHFYIFSECLFARCRKSFTTKCDNEHIAKYIYWNSHLPFLISTIIYKILLHNIEELYTKKKFYETRFSSFFFFKRKIYTRDRVSLIIRIAIR